MKIVVIGGNAAGMSAASRARRNAPKAEITVFEKDETVSYGACGLPYFIGGVIPSAEHLIAVSLKDFIEKRQIAVHVLHPVQKILPRKKTIVVRDSTRDRIFEVPYDKLIISTGASAVVPPIPGVENAGVFKLRTLNDGREIHDFVEQEQPKCALIVGGGYIGLEMAEALHARGIKVHLAEMLPAVMPNMDADMAQLLQEELLRNGLTLHLQNALKRIEAENGRLKATLADNRDLHVDMIVLAIGVRPNVRLAEEAGIELGPTGAIRVNSRMQTNNSNIYAAGDCAEARHLVSGKAAYIPLGTTANKQGRIAGDNASGKVSRFKGIVGTAVVKVFDLEAGMTGLSSKEAEALRIPFKSITIKSRSRAGYYPGAKPLHVKLIFSPVDGKLLGGQIVGGEGVAKRVDVLATALHQKMTVAEVSELDLSYAPPFAPVWDALLVAAGEARKLVRAQ